MNSLANSHGPPFAHGDGMRTTLVLLFSVLTGCMGVLDAGTETVMTTPAADAGAGFSTAVLATPNAFGASQLQRLTRQQLVASAERLFGVTPDVAVADLAPFDSPSSTYFDNDARALSFSLSLITDYESFAWAFAGQVRANPAAFAARAGCTPAGFDDVACFKKYVTAVGRLVFRRALTTAEIDAAATAFMPFATTEQDFFAAVELACAAWLQHPEFLYRIEAGDPTPGAPTALTANEIATRLAFLATGLPPDAELLDAADRGSLGSPQGRANQVQRLLATRAGIEHAQRFHSKWLGYAERFFPPAIAADAMGETNALVEAVVTDPQRDWLTLFTTDETFVTPSLAQHYGLPSPGASAGWVRAGGGRTSGVLTQASFAAIGAKFGDTSPTLRGYETYKRVFCGRLPGDIPDGVDVTMPPGDPSACKPLRYTMRTTIGCQQCHTVMDNIGLGLEQVGPYGEWRASEPSNVACSISGQGSVGAKPFTGPAEFGKLLTEDPRVARCASQQLFESMAGRKTGTADDALLDAMYGQYLETKSYASLVVSLAKSPSFTVKSAN